MFRLIGWFFRGIFSVIFFPLRLLGGFASYRRPRYYHRPPHYGHRPPHYGSGPMHHGPHHY